MNHFLATTTTGTTTGSGYEIWITVGYMAVLFLVFYLLLILPQNKKKKKEEKMRNSIQVGDEITTIGGIVGKVVGIKAGNKEEADVLILETGSERSKIKVKKWAVSSVDTIHDDAQ